MELGGQLVGMPTEFRQLLSISVRIDPNSPTIRAVLST